MIVVIPPKESSHPIEAYVDLPEAMARLQKLPKGTRYASVQVKGDVLKAITNPTSKSRRGRCGHHRLPIPEALSITLD